MSAPRIVVMGPSGSGKSLIGALLATRLALVFLDADDLHPPANRAKMSAGVPLDDEDRMPWLDIVGGALATPPAGAVVACSALRRRYRDRLRAAAADAVFVELEVDAVTLAERMRGRRHFMPPSLLESQLATLEPLEGDEPGVVVGNVGPPESVADAVAQALARR